MNVKPLNSEKGQAIVYLVLGLIVFLGFVALAIDGGMALADRRHEQNAADAASLAGGGKAAIDIEKYGMTTADWSCASLDFAMNNGEVAAVTRADANNFTIFRPADPKYDPNDHNSVVATCNNSGQYIDFTVEISATTPSNFLQLVFPTALHNEVEAVTRVRPGGPLAYANAIVALNPLDCKGASKIGAGFRGDTDVIVIGGGIFSNGCLTGGGSAEVSVDPPYNILYNDAPWEPDDPPPDLFTPVPQSVYPQQIPLSTYDVPIPKIEDGLCVDTTPLTANDTHNVTAKQLEDLAKIAPLNGLYCINGSTNQDINSSETITGTVTIYVMDGINLTINGGAGLELSAPGDTPDPSPAIPGLLIYMSPVSNGNLTINGNSDLFNLTGTILAPGSHIKINGTSETAEYHGQIIGWDVEILGTATIDVTYLGGENASLPTSMELHR